jgi:hypothetical protein
MTSIEIQSLIHSNPFVHIEHGKSAQLFLKRIFIDLPIFLDILQFFLKPAVPFPL